MPTPERGSSEFYIARERVDGLIFDTVKNVAGRRNLPQKVGVLVFDEQTQERYYASMAIQYHSSGLIEIHRSKILSVPSNLSIKESIDQLAGLNPDFKLVCDSHIAEVLKGEVLKWFDDNHFQLSGEGGGSEVEVYTAYPAKRAESDELPEGAESGLIYLDL